MNLPTRVLSVLPFVYLGSCSGQFQVPLTGSTISSSTPFTPSIDQFVEDTLKDWHTPGIAVAVVHENQTWARGYGYAVLSDDPDSENEPFTPHTLTQCGSTTKSFTASAVGLLVDSNTTYKDITWDTLIHELTEDFVMEDDYLTNHITLEDALSHRTGLPRHDMTWLNGNGSIKEMVQTLRYLPTSAEFRTEWQYSNLMYSTVAYALETITGMWHGDIFREWLWGPLGMNETYYTVSEAQECQVKSPGCKLALSYVWNNDTSKHEEVPLESINPGSGAGGVISNVVDYSKWIRTLMYESDPLSAAGHAALKSPRSVVSVKEFPYTGPTFYGLGLIGSVYQGERIFEHNGATLGYFSRMVFLPDRKWGVVTLQNSWSNAQDVIVWRLIDEFLGVPKKDMAKANEHYHNRSARQEKELSSLPSRLYPDTPRIPIAPALSILAYTGTYHHPAYHNITLSISPPSSVSSSAHTSGNGPFPLYGALKYWKVSLIMHHVSGEHWLAEYRMNTYDSKLPMSYTKAKFEVGADGRVESMSVVAEEKLAGKERGWINFVKVA